jgi:hypothetical protein
MLIYGEAEFAETWMPDLTGWTRRWRPGPRWRVRVSPRRA